jgi:hypothetical protein
VIRKLLDRVTAGRAEKPPADPLPAWAGFAATAAMFATLYVLHRVTTERTDQLHELEEEIALRKAELHAIVGLKKAAQPDAPYPGPEDVDPLARAAGEDQAEPDAAERHATMIGDPRRSPATATEPS